MAQVDIRNVEKYYGDVGALHGVSTSIADGEFVTLIGPSGCGKSTLLKIVAGLEEISGGEIAIGGRVINDVAPKDRNVAMVFQSYALYPHMTAAENMGFPLKMQRQRAADIERRVGEVGALLGLGNLLHRLPRQLSGGQRQRVAMGRAIIRSPKVFLFDEPLSNLDATMRVQMRTELKQLHRRLATTMIFVTHDQVEAMTMADRIVVLNAGKVEQEGTPLDLYDRPLNRFVAGFIGSPAMNFFSGRIRHRSQPVFFSDGGMAVPLVNVPADSDGMPVVCGIRPEHFELGAGGAEAEVLEIEPTGLDTQILARVGRHEVVGLFRERITVTPGDRIRFAPKPAHIHIFDKADGRRLA